VGEGDPALAAPAGGGGKKTGPATGGAIGPVPDGPLLGGVVPTGRPKSLRGGPAAGGAEDGAGAPGPAGREAERAPSDGRSSGFARFGRLPGADPGGPPAAEPGEAPAPVPRAAVGGSWSDVPAFPAAASAARALAAAWVSVID
jgi:hypothetical protein